ncbi:MAG: hypothetical protein ACFFD4_38040 [Candidatus Odinarchaeota archaeon]
MDEKPIKLFTWKKLFILVPAVLIGASLSLIREYRSTGTIETISIVISAITAFVGFIIIAAVAWWANKPEK